MSEFYTNVIRYGSNILARGYKDGTQFSKTIKFSPTLYVPDSTPGATSKFKSLDGKVLKPIEFDSMFEAKAFSEKYDGVEGFTIYGNTTWNFQYISEKYTKEVPWNINDIRTAIVDIETKVENGFPKISNPNEEVLLITVTDRTTRRSTTFTTKKFIPRVPNVTVEYCHDERDMFIRFLEFWAKQKFDIVTGWNVKFFDIPYLVARITRILDENWVNKLSPWGKVNLKLIKINDKEVPTYELVGISTLDYLDLYKKYVLAPRENYKLGNIGTVEVNEGKRENPYDSFKEFYEKDWELFCDYNIQDCMLVLKLEDKLKLIELQLTIAYMAKVNYEDIFGQVRVWENIIFNYLKNKNIIPGVSKKRSISSSFEGAYVKAPIKGKHKYVVSFDLDSLYPHLIMQYNMSPETMVTNFTKYRDISHVDRYLHKEIDTSEAIALNYSVTANGVCYDNTMDGFLPALMKSMYSDRKNYKKQMLKLESEYENDKTNTKLKNEIARLNNLQGGLKVSLNSAYGALGNAGFRYFDIRLAEGITQSGQLSIRWVAGYFNKFLNKYNGTEDVDYVIYIDTDSNYLNLEKVVERWASRQPVEPTEEKKIAYMDKFCEEVLSKVIEGAFIDLRRYMNAKEQKMNMKRESLCDSGLFIAKKKYILNVHNSEGVQYDKPKIKAVGVEIVKGSTPELIRNKLKECVPIILNGTNQELRAAIDKVRKEFNTYKIEDIAFPRGITDMEKYQGNTKGTPIGTRAAENFNKLVDKYNLGLSQQKIASGDKVKFIYLRKPNTIQENVIAFQNYLPPEFDLHKYVDYETMFEKVFLNTLKLMAEPMGWSVEEESSLKEFF